MLAKVSKHRLGASATWSHSTDTVAANFVNAEISAFKFNMALTVFDNSVYGANASKIAAANTGRMKFGIYFPTDRWDDPKQPGVFPLIPDYNSTTWTQAAVDAGFNVTVGQSKPTKYPNHGQELYDISNGKYGHDLVNDVAGEIDVLTGLIQHEKNWFYTNFGHYPAAASYRNGAQGSSYAMPSHFLSVRNSAYDVNNVSYNFTLDEAKSLPTTARQGDMPGERAEILSSLETSVQKAIAENGWFRDFTHWHTIEKQNELYEFFESQQNAIGNSEIVSLDYGTALQHKFLSDMATVDMMDSGGTVTLSVAYADPYGDLPLDVFNIPLSVEVDLTGSSLAGKEIASTSSIRKLRENVFIVEVPFNNAAETVSVTLQETDAPNYVDMSTPEIIDCYLLNGELHVVTDKPSKVVLFEVSSGANIYENPSVVTRDNTLTETHVIPYTSSSKDLYIGVIDENEQSILSLANPYIPTSNHVGYLMSADGEKLAFFDNEQTDAPKIFINGKVQSFRFVPVSDPKASSKKMFMNGQVKTFEKVTE